MQKEKRIVLAANERLLQLFKVIHSGLNNQNTLWKMKFIVPQILKLRCFFEDFSPNNLRKKIILDVELM